MTSWDDAVRWEDNAINAAWYSSAGEGSGGDWCHLVYEPQLVLRRQRAHRGCGVGCYLLRGLPTGDGHGDSGMA